MKFEYYGYNKESVKVRKMTMESIILSIAQSMIKNNTKNMKVKIIDCYEGTIDIYNGIEELISKNWTTMQVKVYAHSIMTNIEEKEFIKIIIASNIEQ